MRAALLLVCAALAFAAQLASSAPSDDVDCDKIGEALDDLGSAQGLSTMNDKYKLQTSAAEHTKRCQEMSEAIKTLRRYNKKCFKTLTQQVLSAILKTRSQMNDAHCKDASSAEFAEAVEASKCVAEQALESVRGAEKQIVLSFQVLLDANIADDKLRVRRACCAVLDSKRLFLAASKEKCAKHEKLYNDYVDSFTSEAMGLICPDADKLECAKLEALKTEGVAPRTKFFLTPMIELVKTLDH